MDSFCQFLLLTIIWLSQKCKVGKRKGKGERYRGNKIGKGDERERKSLACSGGGRGVLSNERCCSQNNQGPHFVVCPT